MSSLRKNDLLAQYSEARVLVIGATGFIGRWLSRWLSEAGAELTLIVRNGTRAKEIFSDYGIIGEIVEIDLSRSDSVLDEYIALNTPDIVFNLAGYGIDRSERDENLAYAINADLLESIGRSLGVLHSGWPGQQLVHVGSALEYGTAEGDLDEQTIAMPNTLYGITKQKGTEVVSSLNRKQKKKAVTARLFTVYGPGEHEGRLLPSMLAAVSHNKPIPLTEGLQQRDFTYVEDVVEGMLRLGVVREKLPPIVNLASGKLLSVRQFIETAAEVLKIPSQQLKFGAVPVRVEEMSHDAVTINRLREITGWKPATDVDVGIEKTRCFFQH